MSNKKVNNAYDGKNLEWISIDEWNFWKEFELEKSPFIKDETGKPLYEKIFFTNNDKNEQIR